MLMNDEMTKEFFERHRGGSGNVILAIAVCDDGRVEGNAIFSTIEKAQNWSDKLGDHWSCVFIPMVVDVPEYGNVAVN